MNEISVTGQATVDLLDRQIEALGRMLAGLEAEQQALRARDIDALNASMDIKTECMAQLERLADEIDGHSDESGFDPAIVERRTHVRALGEQCRQINEANGLLITGQQNFITGALGALGVGAAGNTTYGPDGANVQRDKLRQHHLTV